MRRSNLPRLRTNVPHMVAASAATASCILPALLGVASAGTLGLRAALAPYKNTSTPALITLKGGIEPLRGAFNQEVSKTRLLLLVSPT